MAGARPGASAPKKWEKSGGTSSRRLRKGGKCAVTPSCTASVAVDGGVDAGSAIYAWVLKAPDAVLYDTTFAQVGTHGAGPHWTSIDGSTVNGVKLQQNSPYPDAIPWLLLQASSTSGTGVFTDITYVQRLNTAGGNAPATGCDATTVNTDTRVNYSADYYFYTSGVSDSGATGQ